MTAICVFDSGAGGAHVSSVLTAAGIENYLVTCPEMFPFGDKSERQLMEVFFRIRSENEGTIYCACNTMSLVLARLDYDFDLYNVIPTLPQIYDGCPIYATALTCKLVKLRQEYDNRARRSTGTPSDTRQASVLVQAAEDLYQGRISLEKASRIWYGTVHHSKIQMASTHISYLAHALGLNKSHVEPDYFGLYFNNK